MTPRIDERYYLADFKIVDENQVCYEIQATRAASSREPYSNALHVVKYGEIRVRYNKATGKMKLLGEYKGLGLTLRDELEITRFVELNQNITVDGLRYKTSKGYSFNTRKGA
ncbi:hypothetical protein ACFOEK_12200 [Litoribrevibacter euphylliae]|uniref:Uncharacterized protein n=1 Tax=Litoribrevibacter euphylliae TaxID=1834034 RepID=A0ABV7HJF0_9GAMM